MKNDSVTTENNSAGDIKSGLIWTFAERIAAQLVSTVVTIILARLLDPENYGVVAIVMVFINICNVFVTSGMGTALVQGKEITEKDYNSAFVISITISTFIYGVLFLGAPYVASFYQIEQLSNVIRVMGLALPVASINTIQQARIQRKMAFKRFFIATSYGTLLSGAIGIVMAIYGCGVWALVAQFLSNRIINTFIVSFIEKWIPSFVFFIDNAKKIFQFGWKVLATELVFTVESEIRSLMVGKVFGSMDLGFFEQGRKYPALIVQNINASINKVMLPAYAQRQDDLYALKELLRKSIRIGLYYLAPFLVIFAVVSDTLFPLIFTDKWNTCIPFVKVFCVAYLTRPLESSCHQALLGIGRSDTVLRIMTWIQLSDLLLIIIAVFYYKSVLYVAISSILVTIISLCLFLRYTHIYLSYSLKEQLADFCPILFIVLLVAIFVYFLGTFSINSAFKIIIQIVGGVLWYIMLSVLFNLDGYHYTMRLVRKVCLRH